MKLDVAPTIPGPAGVMTGRICPRPPDLRKTSLTHCTRPPHNDPVVLSTNLVRDVLGTWAERQGGPHLYSKTDNSRFVSLLSLISPSHQWKHTWMATVKKEDSERERQVCTGWELALSDWSTLWEQAARAERNNGNPGPLPHLSRLKLQPTQREMLLSPDSYLILTAT